jgi:SAM-dependent methyltransferase
MIQPERPEWNPCSRGLLERATAPQVRSRVPPRATIAAMSFSNAESYDRFMGRYSVVLAPQLADLAGVAPGQRVLDVGCGPGALTGELVRRVGAEAVSAVDPSEPFVAAARERHPGVDVRQAGAEELPFPDDAFDAALAQLVVHFLPEPVTALREVVRVVRPGGVVAASVWDHLERGPLTPFWRAARELDPDLVGEGLMPGVREGHLAELMEAAGLREVLSGEAIAEVRHATFDEWWEPYTLGVGPAGAYVRSLAPERREELRERCRAVLPPAPFVVSARAWAVRGVV